jgi:hypothetical protein
VGQYDYKPHPRDRQPLADLAPYLDRARKAMSRIIQDVPYRQAWAQLHPWCMLCGGPEALGMKWKLHTHHLLGAHRRSDEACNFLRLHSFCHDLCHGFRYRDSGGRVWPTLNLAQQLTLKRDRDPADWSMKRLRELYAPENLPDLEPLPSFWVEKWIENEDERKQAGWLPESEGGPMKRFNVRVPPDWYAVLEGRAKLHGLSVANYVRQKALDAVLLEIESDNRQR